MIYAIVDWGALDKDVVQHHIDQKKSASDFENQGFVFMTTKIILGLMNTKNKLTEEVIAQKSHPFDTKAHSTLWLKVALYLLDLMKFASLVLGPVKILVH